jgi:alpha-beta hydrolase superfamily lysophospholipase
MPSTTVFKESPAGINMLLRHWEASDPWAILVIVHGLAEHRGRYKELGRFFAAAGIEVVSYDKRGYGSSGGRRAYVDHFSDYLDDLEWVLDGVRDRGLPVILFGHSLGGITAFSYTVDGRPEPDLLVLSAPAIDAEVPFPKRAAAHILGRLLPRFLIGNDLDDEQLSSDPDVVAAYHADPLVYERTTARLGLEWLLAMDSAQASLDRLAVRTLVLHGGSDIIVLPRVSEPFERLEIADRIVFPGFRHEIFNEPDARRAMDTMLNWIRAQLEE